ncbi:hypothetical protein NIES593_03295 [Hydrococcus rivularis NIES-593]|uniref:Glutathione S-transferase n=1 Tax=Hydrococcus rivularis NIES-593 TaxID=1921803 RepID=A0A1U7HRF7_9CYAN|nr:hypothetical protein [Hydrococcus rivularis]OKH26114.1 hypothetical protein NIES593_03295 [Hydrococcus rivularis NIES-593]
MYRKLLSFGIGVSLGLASTGMQASVALPPPEDIPEEVLRTEIIIEARSPLDGQPLSATEYAQLEAQIAKSSYPPQLSSQIQQLIFLLNIRKFFTILFPF